MDCEFEACLGYVALAVGGGETETETTEGRREEEGKKERVRKKEGRERERESGENSSVFFSGSHPSHCDQGKAPSPQPLC